MQLVIKGGRIVPDAWQMVADDAELPQGAIIVSLPRWQREGAALLQRGSALGVRLANDSAVTTLAADLPQLALVALEFPKFNDGRAYSQARLLRERYGYCGEIRATGEVLRDQLFFMMRSGFDSFVLRADQNLEAALSAFHDFSDAYQPAADQPLPLFRRRFPRPK